jgi:hypothetical protein
MTRETLLISIAKDKSVRTTCNNISRGKDSDEFYQFILYKICEIPEERLLSIYEKGYLRWYIVSMIVKEGSDWLRPSKQTEYDGNVDFEDEVYNIEIECKVEEVEGKIQGLCEQDRRMLLEYIKLGSYRKLANETGIPYRTIGNNINRIKKQLHENTGGRKR